jgi:hypothetical protein
MYNELTNLLPPMRRRALRYDYFIRLSVIGMILLTSLLLASSVLLLPTYVFLIESARAEKTHLASIESTSSSFDEAALSAQLAALSKSAATLSALAGARSVSATMSAFLAISRPGITLSGFVYSPPTGKNPSTLAISGIAATREALRSYQLALEGAPLARSANLPVSAYAKDTDITFTITVTLSP